LNGKKGETLSSQTFTTDLQWIAEKAATDPKFVFYTIAHHIDEELLWMAFQKLDKKKTPGIDGQTAAEYAEDLLTNLRDLHERLKTKQYRAAHIKRVWIPKDDGTQRPIGMLVLEDKIVQKAVAMLLESVFEADFHNGSYGFRPGRNPHQALHAVRELINRLNVGWILDVDIQQFFDTLDRPIFFDLLHRRVKDGGLDHLLRQWFHVGIRDGEHLSYSDRGTPQGGVVSPVIANIYLHYVLDEWFEQEVKPRLKGRCFLVRFADDAILGFEYEEDARRVREVLFKRLERYGLTAHAKKTRLVKFTRPRYGMKKETANETFDFLGFTHYWAKSRQGNWVIKRRTIGKRLRRAIMRLTQWCKFNRHMSVSEQWRKLNQKLRGYYQYYGIRGNYDCLFWVYYQLRIAWRKWLGKRSQKGGIPWAKFEKILARFPLLRPRIVQKWV
jgi:group II intron reverse transcriptase/maturase